MRSWVVALVCLGLLTASARAEPPDTKGPLETEAERVEAVRRVRLRWAYTAGGVGAALLVIGGAFGISASGSWDRAEQACGGDVGKCRSGGINDARYQRDLAERSAQRANILMPLGVAVLAGGVWLYLTAPAAPARETALRVLPSVAGDSVGVVLSGALR